MVIQLLGALVLVGCHSTPAAAVSTPSPTPVESAASVAVRAPADAVRDPTGLVPFTVPPVSSSTLSRGRHIGSITSSAFTEGAVATGAWDGSVRIWTPDGTLVRVLIGLTEDVEALAFSPDGDRIAAVSRNSNGRIWRLSDGAELARLDDHQDSVESVIWFPSGERVMTGSWDGDVRVWDATSGQPTARFKAHEEGIFALALSPNSRRVVSGSQDRSASLWNVDTGKLVRALMPHDDAVYSAAWSPYGSHFATGGRDGRVFVYASDSPLEGMAADLNLGEPVLAVSFEDEDTVLAVGWAGAGRRWSIKTGLMLSDPLPKQRSEVGALLLRGP